MTQTIKTDNRIVGAVSRSPGRYTINGLLVQINDDKTAIACATDGRMASVRPVDVEGDIQSGSFMVPGELLKNPTKRPQRFSADLDRTGVAVRELGRGDVPKSVDRTAPYQEAMFPPLAEIIPSKSSAVCWATVMLNPELLYKAMLAAQGNDERRKGVTIMVPFLKSDVSQGKEVCERHTNPVLLAGEGEDGGVSALMPMVSELTDPIGRVRSIFGSVKPTR